ncbi:MAG: ATP-binding protein [Alicyclobacillaceae bacterium]|nr:ATP-binding protein [Alicyclobacillaceae bacterium]
METIFWEDNRIFAATGAVYGVFRLNLSPYENQTVTVRRALTRQMETFFETYFGEGQLLSLATPASTETVVKRMRQLSHHAYWESHIELVRAQIERRGVFERKVYLIVPLGSSWQMSWDAMLDRPDEWLQRTGEQFKRLAGWLKRKRLAAQGVPLLSERELNSARRAEQRMFHQLGSVIPNLVPATAEDVEFLHRSPYYRGLVHVPSTLSQGIGHTVTVEGGELLLRPQPMALDLGSHLVREDTFRVRVEHADRQVSYQSVLAMANVKESIRTIGDEWLYELLELLDFPVDACLHFRTLSPMQARDIVFRKRKIVMAQGEEYATGGDVPWDVYDALDAAKSLQAKVQDGQPVVEFRGFLAVGAGTEGEMRRREQVLQEVASTHSLRLVHPPGDAYKLFRAFFPAEKLATDRKWLNAVDPSYVAASGLLGTARVGDPSGQWFARSRLSGTPVWVDWYRAMTEENRTGAAAFLGTLGSGKSVAMKYAADTMMQWGAIGVVVDPKQAEYACLVHLWRNETVWWRFGFGSELYFTPFRLGRDRRESKQFAAGFLAVLLNVGSDLQSQWANNALSNALDRMYQGERWDMRHYLAALEAVVRDESCADEERKVARLYRDTLSRLKDDEQGRAIFGEDGADNRMDDRARLVVVSIMGLEFPEAGQSPLHWRPGQRFAVAVLYLITRIGFMRLMSAPAHVKKFFLIDEAWILRSIPEGRALINSILLTGRSMNIVLLLGMQNPDVLLPSAEVGGNDDIAANLGWIFVGRLLSEMQVRHAVQLLGLPDDVDQKEYRQQFESFEKGLGYLRDPYGRVGVVQVDVLDGELLRRFTTTPGGSAP